MSNTNRGTAFNNAMALVLDSIETHGVDGVSEAILIDFHENNDCDDLALTPAQVCSALVNLLVNDEIKIVSGDYVATSVYRAAIVSLTTVPS